MKTVTAPTEGLAGLMDSVSALMHGHPFGAYVVGVMVLAVLAYRFRDSF